MKTPRHGHVDAATRKKIAVAFLEAAASGKEKAVKQHLAFGGSHHNPFFEAGWDPLVKGMMDAAKTAPKTRLTVKHVVAEEDLVAVHSHVVHAPGGPGIAVVHLLRFLDDKIVEMWDVGQELPKDSPNTDKAF